MSLTGEVRWLYALKFFGRKGKLLEKPNVLDLMDINAITFIADKHNCRCTDAQHNQKMKTDETTIKLYG